MDLAQAIAQIEGYNTPGTIAQRNNNPGNLRYSPLQSGTEQTVNGKFATFESPEVGWQALQDYIAKNQNLTLRDFTYKYAPPTENNTAGYLSWLSGQVGIGVDSPISELYGNGMDSVSSVSGSVSDLFSGSDSTTGIAVLGLVALAVVVIVKG